MDNKLREKIAEYLWDRERYISLGWDYLKHKPFEDLPEGTRSTFLEETDEIINLIVSGEPPILTNDMAKNISIDVLGLDKIVELGNTDTQLAFDIGLIQRLTAEAQHNADVRFYKTI
jgi:hypothetical protein